MSQKPSVPKDVALAVANLIAQDGLLPKGATHRLAEDRIPARLVPIAVDALPISESMRSDVDWISKKIEPGLEDRSKDRTSLPEPEGACPYEPGVLLRWTMPDSLVEGDAGEDGEGEAEFPLLPDRFLVVRFFSPTGAPLKRRIRTFEIANPKQQTAVGPDGSESTDPHYLMLTCSPEHPFSFLDPWEELEKDLKKDFGQTEKPLTQDGGGGMLTDKPKEAGKPLSYLVVGWYDALKEDLLFDLNSPDLHRQALDAGEARALEQASATGRLERYRQRTTGALDPALEPLEEELSNIGWAKPMPAAQGAQHKSSWAEATAQKLGNMLDEFNHRRRTVCHGLVMGVPLPVDGPHWDEPPKETHFEVGETGTAAAILPRLRDKDTNQGLPSDEELPAPSVFRRVDGVEEAAGTDDPLDNVFHEAVDPVLVLYDAGRSPSYGLDGVGADDEQQPCRGEGQICTRVAHWRNSPARRHGSQYVEGGIPSSIPRVARKLIWEAALLDAEHRYQTPFMISDYPGGETMHLGWFLDGTRPAPRAARLWQHIWSPLFIEWQGKWHPEDQQSGNGNAEIECGGVAPPAPSLPHGAPGSHSAADVLSLSLDGLHQTLARAGFAERRGRLSIDSLRAMDGWGRCWKLYSGSSQEKYYSLPRRLAWPARIAIEEHEPVGFLAPDYIEGTWECFDRSGTFQGELLKRDDREDQERLCWSGLGGSQEEPGEPERWARHLSDRPDAVTWLDQVARRADHRSLRSVDGGSPVWTGYPCQVVRVSLRLELGTDPEDEPLPLGPKELRDQAPFCDQSWVRLRFWGLTLQGTGLLGMLAEPTAPGTRKPESDDRPRMNYGKPRSFYLFLDPWCSYFWIGSDGLPPLRIPMSYLSGTAPSLKIRTAIGPLATDAALAELQASPKSEKTIAPILPLGGKGWGWNERAQGSSQTLEPALAPPNQSSGLPKRRISFMKGWLTRSIDAPSTEQAEQDE